MFQVNIILQFLEKVNIIFFWRKVFRLYRNEGKNNFKFINEDYKIYNKMNYYELELVGINNNKILIDLDLYLEVISFQNLKLLNIEYIKIIMK